jgi:hypothetical protein
MQDQIGCWNITANMAVTTAAPKALIQYVATSTNTAEVIYFSASQSGSTASAQDRFGLIVPAAAVTGTAGVSTPGATANVFDLAGGASTLRASLSTTTLCTNAPAPTTINGVARKFNFNVLAGYEWNAQPNNRVWIPASGIIILYCYAITTTTWDVELTIRESK